MSEPFIGQVTLFSFKFPPKGWAFCNGQLMPVAQNQALFALLGTQFGGDGRTTFALPNLQGNVIVGVGGGQTIGATGGEVAHTLVAAENPSHQHSLNADARTAATSNGVSPGGNVLGQSIGTDAGKPNYSINLYSTAGPSGGNQLSSSAVGQTGGQPHPNMMPSLVLDYCIALTGIFPPRN